MMRKDVSDQKSGFGRDRLIEAALSCMADYGQEGTTVRKIAERAKVTPGLVKHHFKSKEGLMVETYQHLNEIAVAQIRSALSTNQENINNALEGAINALFPDNLRDVRRMRVLIAFWGQVPTNPKFAEVQRRTNATIHDLFVLLIESHLGPKPEASDLANGIIAVTDGLWLECCMNPDRMSPKDAIKIAIQFSRKSLDL